MELKDLKWELVDTAYGQWSDSNDKYSINYSSILTLLIKKAGNLCDRYSSDLFIDWIGVANDLKNINLKNKEYLFGFRSNGVDHKDYVKAMLDAGEEKEYKELYKLEISIKSEHHWYSTVRDITFELFKCTNLK